MLSDRIVELADTLTRCVSLEASRRASLDWIARAIGIDAGLVVDANMSGEPLPSSMGLGAQFFRELDGDRKRYLADIAEVAAQALERGAFLEGPENNLEWWIARRGGVGIEAELMKPRGLLTWTMGPLLLQGRCIGTVMVAREGNRHLFSARELWLLNQALPVLALAEASHAVRPRNLAREAGLSSAEAALLDFVALGLTNAQIGAALGRSPNTVRNQLLSVFRKVGVGSRAELSAWVATITAAPLRAGGPMLRAAP